MIFVTSPIHRIYKATNTRLNATILRRNTKTWIEPLGIPTMGRIIQCQQADIRTNMRETVL